MCFQVVFSEGLKHIYFVEIAKALGDKSTEKSVNFPLKFHCVYKEKDALCQVWMKLAQWFWRRRFLNFVNVFSLFCNYLPLKKGWGSSFEQTWIPFTQGCFVPSLVEIGPVVLEKRIKMWQVYRQTNGWTDGRQAIRKAHLSLRLKSANKSGFFSISPLVLPSGKDMTGLQKNELLVIIYIFFQKVIWAGFMKLFC